MRHNRLRALLYGGASSIGTGLRSGRLSTPAAPLGDRLTGEASEARQ